MKPSKIISVTAKKALFLLPNFRALTWRGTIYCKMKADVDLINYTNEITSDLKSHETIHVRQAESTHDSWLLFYTLYILLWLRNFPLFIYGAMMPYYFIEFELEAYNNERNHKYATKGAVYQWKKFKKLTMKQKLILAKTYKHSPLGFKNFTRQVIAPIVVNED